MAGEFSWNEWLEKGKSVARAVGQKTEEAVDAVSLKVQIASVEHQLKGCYEVLGRLHFRAGKTGEDLTPELEACTKQCEELNQKLERLEREWDESCNIIRCPSCEAGNPSDSAFCRICGEKMP